jgi:endo-1,4-beta-xylanase
VHAVWADEFFAAFLKARIPNLEMHVYVNGGYGGGLTDRGGIPFGTWQYRFIDWFRDLGFLQKAALRRKRRGMLLCAWRNRRRRGCHDAVCQIGATAW